MVTYYLMGATFNCNFFFSLITDTILIWSILQGIDKGTFE